MGESEALAFIDGARGKPKCVLVQVKSGKVTSGHLRDLRGAVERENAAIGVLITLEPPTSAMKEEAISAGFYDSPVWQRHYPRIQILTIEELLAGEKIQMLPQWGTFKRAQQAKKEQGVQVEMDI